MRHLRSIFYFLLLCSGLWLFLSLGLLLIAPSLIFHPGLYKELKANYTYEQFFLKNQRQENIEFWFKPHPSSKEVIIYLHGNGGRNPYYVEELGKHYHVLSPSYPGFQDSQGTPNTQSVYEMAKMAMEYLLSKGYAQESILVWGHSMGGSPAVYLATQYRNLKKVILVNTFDSIKNMAQRRYGSLSFFGGYIFNSQDLARSVKGCVRQYHVVNDHVVPCEAGINLFNSLKTKNKKFTVIEGEHNHFDISETLREDSRYLVSHPSMDPKKNPLKT